MKDARDASSSVSTVKDQTLVKKTLHNNKAGQILKFNTFQETTVAIQDFETETVTKFVFLKKEKNDLTISRVQWDTQERIPFVVKSYTKYECQHGKDRNKNRNLKRQTQFKGPADHMYEAKKYLCVQGSKKMNCTARLNIREILIFPDQKVNSGADEEKRRVSKHLKTVGFSSIKNSTCRFIVLFPSIHDHSGHPVGEAAGIQQRVDSRVIDKVGELIDDRVCSIMEIQRHLKVFVVKELFKNATPPLQSNRRFFPTKKDISNHYYNAYTKRKLSKIDQANVQLLVDEWSCKSPKDNIVFRPYIASGCPKPLHEEIGNDDITALDSKQTLLFIYQTAWQKRLLLRYGQDICLLDATYKTSKYALPLFFLCIKTNVNYQVVACFVTQNERQSDITEALEMIKIWTPEWNPKFFMTDKCEAEINAVEATFQEMGFTLPIGKDACANWYEQRG
uniref:uncharacterized protein LOC104265996 isoform X2 n=1 Tax=Ciona intestinalis TaxID=7719 RepID=UPI00089DCCA8|nr:uncharacterized protein LOC104265996 isoform X2 [Ciona intestinalis]|eukprot:XP_018672308.1 uncharacterized protein LOC104265996 isoform X2 [Ciona intestinalis]